MAVVQKRKIRWVISLVLVMLYFSGLTAQAQYGEGIGEPNDPYLIYTAEQMNAIGADANDLESGFQGTTFNDFFNGNGHTIPNWAVRGVEIEAHIVLL
jgi:hypothetical protein